MHYPFPIQKWERNNFYGFIFHSFWTPQSIFHGIQKHRLSAQGTGRLSGEDALISPEEISMERKYLLWLQTTPTPSLDLGLGSLKQAAWTINLLLLV